MNNDNGQQRPVCAKLNKLIDSSPSIDRIVLSIKEYNDLRIELKITSRFPKRYKNVPLVLNVDDQITSIEDYFELYGLTPGPVVSPKIEALV